MLYTNGLAAQLLLAEHRKVLEVDKLIIQQVDHDCATRSLVQKAQCDVIVSVQLPRTHCLELF